MLLDHPESAPVETLHVWEARASDVGPCGTFGSLGEAEHFLGIVQPLGDGDVAICECIVTEHLKRRIPKLFQDAFK